jgi:hypothetical protein
MNPEPRQAGDYSDRQVEAARRVLVDVGQVLASFRDVIVVVGGWVPDLLPSEAHVPHIGSIDVDLALDAAKLQDGRYAELLKLLLDTGRYERGDKDFQFVTSVDLGDGEAAIQVEVEFLASSEVKLKSNHPKLVQGFRVLQFPAFEAAFSNPEEIKLEGVMISGASNTVYLRVASLADFILMKAHAVDGRDKPKDVYDICYCLDEFPKAFEGVANDWQSRRENPLVAKAVDILHQKFESVDHYGPRQLAIFHDATGDDAALYARRAFELVQKLLSLLVP